MESKKIEKKLNTWFWWILTALPIWCIFFGIISSIVLQNRNLVINHYEYDILSDILNDENWVIGNFLYDFIKECSIPSLKTTFQNILESLGLQFRYGVVEFMGFSLAYMLSIQIYHLVYDILKFIIAWCHTLIEKAYK